MEKLTKREQIIARDKEQIAKLKRDLRTRTDLRTYQRSMLMSEIAALVNEIEELSNPAGPRL